MSNDTNIHPEKWSIPQLLAYCAQFNISVKPTATKKELIEKVLKDEIDKE